MSKGREQRRTLTANGRVSVARRRWQAAARGGGGDMLIDRLLDAAEATVSRGTRQLCCLLNADAASFERAADNLLGTTGIRMGSELLRQVVEQEGKHVLACADAGRLGVAWGAGDCQPAAAQGTSRQYLGCDGFTARVITDAEKKRRRRQARQKRRRLRTRPKPLSRAKPGADQPFKEFKRVTFYDEPAEHRLVSVTRHDHHAARRLMRRDGVRCGFFDTDQKLAVVDGGPWIINQIRRQSLPVDAVCLDFFHLAENVHKARRSCFGEEDPAGHAWASGLLHAAKHQGYEDLLDQLVKWRGAVARRAALAAPTPRRRPVDQLRDRPARDGLLSAVPGAGMADRLRAHREPVQASAAAGQGPRQALGRGSRRGGDGPGGDAAE